MEKTWLKHYDPRVSAEIDADRYASVVDIFEQSVKKFKNKEAFINMGHSITFEELDTLSAQFAAYLQASGLKRGDAVAIMMPNLLQYPVAMFGILRAGMVVVNVNPLYTARELKHQLNDANAKAIVIVENFACTLEEVIADTNLQEVFLTALGDTLPAPKRWIVNAVVKYVKKMVPSFNLPETTSFMSAVKKGQSLEYKRPDIDSGDLSYSVLENENARQVIYIEYIDDNIFRKLIEPKHFWNDEGIMAITEFKFLLKDDLSEIYEKIGIHDAKNKPLVIIPTFTASAYAEPGFYTFYRGECDTELHGMLFRDSDCLTVEILSKDNLQYSSSSNAVQILELLGYESITDMELHTNPSILDEYDKIIVLHNEYVSKIMFDAITSHNNVIFLYPNALYAEVQVDIINNTITLIRGHNYPDLTISNGFDWENDNTHPFEYDNECKNWEFYSTNGMPNGYMLNCFPENKIWHDQLFLQKLKDL